MTRLSNRRSVGTYEWQNLKQERRLFRNDQI